MGSRLILPKASDIPDEALRHVSNLLIPKLVDKNVITAYVKKAIRVNVWRFLSIGAGALLKALIKWRGIIKSGTLLTLLREIFIQIELNTLRGKALFYGTIIAIRSNLIKILNSIVSLLYIKISYLNNSPMFGFPI